MYVRLSIIAALLFVGCDTAAEAPVTSQSGLSAEAVSYSYRAVMSAGEQCDEDGCQKEAPILESDIAPATAWADTWAARSNHSLALYQAQNPEEAASSKKTAIQASAETPDGQLFTVKLWLLEDGLDDITELRYLDGDQRRQWIENRIARFSSTQNAVEEEVQGLGGIVQVRLWLSNSLIVAVPSQALPQLLENSLIFGAYLPGNGQNEYGDGVDRRTAVHPTGMLAIRGATGHNANASIPINIGVLETGFGTAANNNTINKTHIGWFDTPGANNRIQNTVVCDSTASGCASSPSAVGTSDTHGTSVAAVASGGIMEGQDPAFPSTTEREKRSGLASDARIDYIMAASPPGFNPDHSINLLLGLEAAIGTPLSSGTVLHDDVVNMSWGISNGCGSLCSYSFADSSAFSRAEVDQAVEAGAVVIKSAGNRNDDCGGTCNVTYPGMLQSVITAGGLDTLVGTNIHDVQLALSSSRGSILTHSNDGTATTRPLIGLVLPSVAELYLAETPSTYHTIAAVKGTTLSAALLTSLAAVTREHWNSLNPAIGSNAWLINATLLAMGDGRAASQTIRTLRADDDFGFGLPLYFLDPGDLGTNYRIDISEIDIAQSQTVSWWLQPKTLPPGSSSHPMPADTTGFKWVVLLEYKNDTLFPKLNVKVQNWCPIHGGPPGTLAVAQQRAGRYRIIIDDSTAIQGKCLKASIEGLSVASGGVRVASFSVRFNSPVSGQIYVP